MDTSTFSLVPGNGISAGFADVDLIDIDISKDDTSQVHWKLRSRMPFEVVLDSSLKFSKQGKTGLLLNNDKSFEVNEALEAPLHPMRDPYSDLRDFYTDQMKFSTYSKGSNNEVLTGFMDFYSPSNKLLLGDADRSVMKTFKELMNKNTTSDGSSTPKPVTVPKPEPVIIPEPEPVNITEPEPVKMPEPEPVNLPEPEVDPIDVPEPEVVTVPGPKPAAVPQPDPKPQPVTTPKPDPQPEPVSIPDPPLHTTSQTPKPESPTVPTTHTTHENPADPTYSSPSSGNFKKHDPCHPISPKKQLPINLSHTIIHNFHYPYNIPRSHLLFIKTFIIPILQHPNNLTV